MTSILIVDDVLANIRVIEAAFAETDFTLYTAMNGSEAITLAHEFLPDLILLDVMMPGMNGFEVCAQLKASRSTARIPVLFLSALTESEERIKALRIGGEDFIPKPVSMEEVLARVQIHLRLHARQQELERLNLEARYRQQLDVIRRQLLEQSRHDIKNRMANLSVLLYLLNRTSAANSPESTIYYDRTQTLILDIADTLEALLNPPTSEAAQVALIRSVPIHAFLERALFVYKFSMQAQYIQVQVKADPISDDIAVHIDPDQMQNVLTTLIDNAIKHMPAGGAIFVRAVIEREALIIEVEDSCGGIAVGSHRHIFDDDRRTASHEEAISSQDMELSTVRAIVEAHGGKIRCRSDAGKSACISIWLPQTESLREKRVTIRPII